MVKQLFKISVNHHSFQCFKIKQLLKSTFCERISMSVVLSYVQLNNFNLCKKTMLFHGDRKTQLLRCKKYVKKTVSLLVHASYRNILSCSHLLKFLLLKAVCPLSHFHRFLPYTLYVRIYSKREADS